MARAVRAARASANQRLLARRAVVAMLKAAAASDAGAPVLEPVKILPPRRQVHKASAAANPNQKDLFDG